MSATEANPSWSEAVVRAPQALGLGSPRLAAAPPPPAPPPPAPPAAVAPPVAADPTPKPVRLPSAASDQEGVYEGLLWAVRALEECGRAFTRLTLRMGKVEVRLGAVEDGQGRLAAVEQRLLRLEEAAAAPPPARVVPLRPDPDLATLRRELATATVRLARLEGDQRRAERPPSELEEHVNALEQDVVGVYRELDGVAQRVDDRLRSALAAVGELASRLDRMAAEGPHSLERRLGAVEARLERAESPRSQAERLHSALEQVLGRGAAVEPVAPAVPAVPVAPCAPPPPPPAPATVVAAAPRPWPRSELARPALDLTPADVRSRAASVLTAELDRIRTSLGALGADVPTT